MIVKGLVKCKICGQVIDADDKDYYSCDEKHFEVKLGVFSNTYSTVNGMGLNYEVIEQETIYSQDDFTKINEKSLEVINKLWGLGVGVHYLTKTNKDGQEFKTSIYSDYYGFNKRSEKTELDLTIYLDKMYENSEEDVYKRLDCYYKVIKMIKNKELDINDRNKIQELDLHLDGEEKQKELYDVSYYF